jgi:hypothetical protein
MCLVLLVTRHCILRICDGDVVVFPYGSVIVNTLVKHFAKELSEVDNFPRCVGYGMVFRLRGG